MNKKKKRTRGEFFSYSFYNRKRVIEEVKGLGLDGWFMWFILFWVVVLVGTMGIGGFFMFRKFLKSMPKKDGKSTLDWQDHYVSKTVHLWGTEAKDLLNELVTPVPELFRDVAKQKIARKNWRTSFKGKCQGNYV